MAEDRFETEVENMADYMAQRLPREDALKHFGPFYEEVWHFYLEHMEWLELFSKVSESQKAFQECLQLCKDEGNVALFAAALALRKEKLQKSREELLYL